MSAPAPRISALAAQQSLHAKGIHSQVQGEQLFVTTGEPSQNLVCLQLGLYADPLPREILDLMTGPLITHEDGRQQYWYRCTTNEKTRRLTDHVTMYGDGDAVETYPSPGYARVESRSFGSIPILSWTDHCEIASLLMMGEPAPVPGPLPETTDENVDQIYETMHVTQDNVAMVFEDRYKDELRYCDAWGQWLKWNCCRWKPERTMLAFDQCRMITRKLNSTGLKDATKASFAAGVERFARASRTFATLPEEWDKNALSFNALEGTTDLGTMETRPHSPADYLTKAANVSPKNGPHPIFDLFMKDICLGDESLIQYHQRALGACLSGAIQDNFLLFWFGTGQNGKNTFGELIEWILGDYCKVIPAETLMADKNGSRHPTDLANLRGVRLAISSEVEEGSYFNEQRIKSLTGDMTISARFMRQDYFEFTRTHKHLIYGNHRPLLRVVDPALRARMHIVPFKAYFPPEVKDPDMPRRLKAEAPAILSWLMEGHRQWTEDGYLKKCSAVQAETDAYFESQSTPDMWLAECCNLGETESENAKPLYDSFKAWKESRGEGAMSQTRWGEWMRRYEKTTSHGRILYRGLSVKLPLQRSV